MPRGIRTVMSVAACGIAALALAGCTPDEPEPAPSSSPSATPTPTPTASAAVPTTAPTMPAAMDGDDEAAAIAAAQYFLELYDYVYATGDLEEWDRISGQTCEFCASVRADVVSIYETGGKLSRPATEFADFRVVGYDTQLGIYAVLLNFTVAEGTVQDAAGSATVTAAEASPLRLDLGPSVRGWLLYAADATPNA